MGEDVTPLVFSRADRARYRQKVRRCVEVLTRMLDGARFDAAPPLTGLEIEIDLVDADADPAMRNEELLAGLADPAFQTELARYNLELNAHPRLIEGDGFLAYERDLAERLARAGDRATKVDSDLIMIGILPTLTPAHTVPDNFSPNPRYHLLNEEILAARGEDVALDIQGVERLQITTESIGPESAGTAIQFHLQVAPEQFAGQWNASQAIAAAQVAVGANSPYLFAHRLWDETRIILFEQSTDTRPYELKAQGVRPRAWFGERWVDSVVDLFWENVRYFPPLLPICEDEDPAEALRSGRVPRLGELRLHNGTIYRWNRPIYDVMDGRPHLRVENRVLSSGPTLVDMLANAAFYLGLTKVLAEQERPIWHRLSFETAAANFHLAAREGLSAGVQWPGLGEVRVTDLVQRQLLPLAYQGLDRYGVAGAVRDRLLDVIDERCRTGRNGAVWQTKAVQAAERRGRDRPAALRAMLQRYLTNQRTNEPVHTWPVE